MSHPLMFKRLATALVSLRRHWLLPLAVVFGMSLSGCHLFHSTPPAPLPLGPGVSSHNKAMAREHAERVYQEAWRMVMQEYVDPTFNGQDWYQWKDHYKGLLKDPEDAYVGIQTMVASLNDAYTRFLPPREMNEQTISIDSRLFGIGVQISMRDGKLVVVSVFEDTPAARAGMLPKDIISRIEGQETTGMSVEDAADRIRGPEGTSVNLTIVRGSEDDPKESKQTLTKAVPRAEIKIKSVFTQELPTKSIGYLRLSSFISETEIEEMYEVAQKLQDKKALILDLRGNYGGLLSNAVEIADFFLNRGDIVSIVDRQQKKRSYSATPGTLLNQPMVVLVDGGSASASEILSGALKDHRRATLIGTQTFGKGLVQKIVPLQDGSGLNITISKYLTPNGTDINQKGISPDIEVHYTHKDFFAGKDPQLEKAEAFLKQRYHL